MNARKVKADSGKDYKIANEPMYRAMLGLRSSSAASPHDARPNRERTRMDVKRKFIEDSEKS